MGMSGQDMQAQMYGLTIQLREEIKMYKKFGLEHAHAKMVYNIAYAKQQMIEKTNGTAVTLMDKKIKGTEHTAKLAFEMDRKEVFYNTANLAQQATKKEMEYANDRIKEEYYTRGD